MNEFKPPNDSKVSRVCEILGYDCNNSFPTNKFDTVKGVKEVNKMLTKYSVSTAEDYIWRLTRYIKQIPGFRLVEEYCKLLEIYREYTRTHICD